MKRTVRKVKRIVCCLLIGLLLAEQIVATHAEENGQQYTEEDAGNGTVSGNDAVPDSVSNTEIMTDGGLSITPYAEDSRAVGESFDLGGLRYTIRGEDTVECSGYVGSKPNGEVIIPKTVVYGSDTYTVCSIGNEAFKECHGITSVALPDTITVIGDDAFDFCSQLQTINIPENVTSIGSRAFRTCSRLDCKIILPEGLTVIATSAFEQCSKLEIVLPSGLTEIGTTAFFMNEKMESIEIPESVRVIGNAAFKSSQLKSVNIPGGVKRIDDLAFQFCPQLQNVTLSDGIEEIGQNAFGVCSSLSSIEIPQSVTSVEDYAFSSCSHLEKVKLWDTTSISRVCAFSNCSKLKVLEIVITRDSPLTMYPLDKYMFEGCPDDRSLVFLDEDGNRLTGAALTAAQEAYRGAIDGNTKDDLWYGWKIDAAPVEQYTVTFYDGDTLYGEDTPQRPQTVLEGGNATEPENPEKEGFTFKGWMTEKDGDTPFDFTKGITENINVYAGWEENKVVYQITATANGGGIISPDGTVKVNEGANRTFTITPQEGYEIQEVLVDGKSQGAIATYTFTNVTENHTISVSFLKKEKPVSDFQITATAGEGGSISPAGTVHVTTGGGQAFTITPDEGYRIADVLVDGKSQGVIDNYTFTNVKENHTISASFLKKEETGGTEKPGENEGGTGGTEKPGENAGGTGETEKPGENAGENKDVNQPEENESDRGTEDDGNAGGTGASGAAVNPGTGSPREPKTGDVSSVEIYATAAMIAGLLYLLLSFAEMKGLTEAKKKEIISSIIGWANEGRKYRRYAAFAAIFFVLVYYHSIGKSIMTEEKCLTY